jgi:hypothetical protein
MAGRDKGTDDIVGRLEALRKRVPDEKEVAPIEDEGPEDRRKKTYRYVGIAIIVLIIIGVMFFAYKYAYAPAREQAEAEKALKIQEQTAFIQAKSEKMAEIQGAYIGLPSEYRIGESLLLEQARAATSTGELDAVDVSGPATAAWRAYLQEKLDDITKGTDNIGMRIGTETYKGYDDIRRQIQRESYSTLETAVIQELQTEIIPIRLPRLQAGGAPDVGNVVNVYYKTVIGKVGGSNISLLAKDARVVAVIRAKSSGSDVDLSESESQLDSGGGAEGFGVVTGLSTQATSATLSGVFEGSAGLKSRQTTTKYKVKIDELQKAAAASKLPEGYITEVLENYGIKLDKIERESNIGDLDTEYLMLLEVGEDEALAVVQKVADENERLGKDRTKMNIFITMSKLPSWASNR